VRAYGLEGGLGRVENVLLEGPRVDLDRLKGAFDLPRGSKGGLKGVRRAKMAVGGGGRRGGGGGGGYLNNTLLADFLRCQFNMPLVLHCK
jgi:hypothetical protein